MNGLDGGACGVDRLTPKTNVLAALNPRLRKFMVASLLRFVVARLPASASVTPRLRERKKLAFFRRIIDSWI